MLNAKLKDQIAIELGKSRGHLEYSFKKVSLISLSGSLSEEQLETLESFASRFARFSDIAINKYFTALMLQKDPGFRGSVIDLLNQAEKYRWIGSKQDWVRIRELRNVAAHEYAPDDYKALYQELITIAPTLLQLSLSL